MLRPAVRLRRQGGVPAQQRQRHHAVFAVAVSGTGLLTTVGVVISVGSFGPVTDNFEALRRGLAT